VTGGSGFIGAEVIKEALARGCTIKNLDLRPPKIAQHIAFWEEIDLRAHDQVVSSVTSFRPDYIIHLASDIDVNLKSLKDYRTITEGTKNIIAAAQSLAALRRFVHISTQYVVSPEILPKGEDDFAPYTLYGEAKAISERIVRSSTLKDWIILRPTIIWGPGHPSFAAAIWRHIALGTYLHPLAEPPILKSYGYVTNCAAQIITLMQSASSVLGRRRVFYLGDGVISYDIWVDAFAMPLTGRPARRVRKNVLYVLALCGDFLKCLGFRSPFDMGRYFRMTTSANIDLSATLAITGAPKVGFHNAVEETVRWLEINDKRFIRRFTSIRKVSEDLG